jgi:hypothetical protein
VTPLPKRSPKAVPGGRSPKNQEMPFFTRTFE